MVNFLSGSTSVLLEPSGHMVKVQTGSDSESNVRREVRYDVKYSVLNITFLLIPAQVPDSDEQFVPDFHSENCK